MRKISCLIFALLLVLSLAACGGPTYRSSANIIVNVGEEKTLYTYSDLANEELLAKAITIMESQQVMEKVCAELDGTITSKELAKCLTVEVSNSASVIYIAVEGDNAIQTEKIAECYLSIAIDSVEQQIKDAEVKRIDHVSTGKVK